MTPGLILSVFLIYTAFIFIVSWLTSRKANSDSFYSGNKVSPWFIVAYGMIGASLSGVTFMSVPGWVKDTQFSYLMVVFGYLFGYLVIATVLLPLYYRLNLTSIYSYLETRFGFFSYKTGASFFILSRTLGASLRIFLVVNVLQVFVFDSWNIPFVVTVLIFISLIILYTYKGGIKTIIWTDTFQTTFMLLAVVISIYLITKGLNVDFKVLWNQVWSSDYSNMIVTDWHKKNHFLKQFLSGIFITITMTGLDQEMMQKNLSCKNIKEAQKNMFSFSFILIFVNLMFLLLGAFLLIYAKNLQLTLPQSTDDIFPFIALSHLGPFAGLIFLVGLISAAYPSADGALTSLTTSFSIDILGLNKKTHLTDKKRTNIRYMVHFSFAFVFLLLIVYFRTLHDEAIIQKLFTIAGYTYGPLLGLYSFGLFTKRKVKDVLVPFAAVAAPVICYIISHETKKHGYEFGFELLILNGLLMFYFLWQSSSKVDKIDKQ